MSAPERGIAVGGSRKRDSSAVISTSAAKATSSLNTTAGTTAFRMPSRAPLDDEKERTMEVVWVKYQAKAAWWPGIVYDPMIAPQGEMRKAALLHTNSKVTVFLLNFFLLCTFYSCFLTFFELLAPRLLLWLQQMGSRLLFKRLRFHGTFRKMCACKPRK